MLPKRIIGIAACDPHGIMGKDNRLPWHCPEELQHFCDTVAGHPLIIGYNTYLSMPDRYFKDRQSIVFAHQGVDVLRPGVIAVSNLGEFFAAVETLTDQTLYVIGGAQIYTLFLKENLIAEFILTTFKDTYAGDTYFPLDLLRGWTSVRMRDHELFRIDRYYNPSLEAHAN